jgi:DNA-binding MarR family transcriptional regulator
VVARAGVSQRALDEVFGGIEGCFLAAFEEGLGRLSGVVAEAAGREVHWLGRVRGGLVALLGFFDDEPGWGRLLVLQMPLDCEATLRCQQRVLGVLTVLMDDGSPQVLAEIMPEAQLTSELLIGGVFAVIRARMLERAGDALVELAPSLMTLIVGPYLGQAAANAELVGRPAPAARMSSRADSRTAGAAARFPMPFHHRTALVLRVIACAPRLSNREIAEAAGLTDKGQTSHLLRRLARRGLIEKVAPRSGSRRENAWLLTPSGRRVVKLLGVATEAGSSVSAVASARQAA